MTQSTANTRIKQLKPLIAPNLLAHELPISTSASALINQARDEISQILQSKDDRILLIVGPCSIHDPKGALDYAKRLKQCADQYKSNLHIIMRVYFEKPRTTIGWKGLINDPKLDNSFNINEGLRAARKLLLEINELGLPTGTEFLDTIIPQYISDLISWAAIGARTTESQIHRELSSGLSMPVGFKNGTTGNIQIAIDAISAASHPHHFLGVTTEGNAAIVTTNGNPDCHIILRGSNKGPNYEKQSVNDVVEKLQQNQLTQRLMIDCSHGNSNKDHVKQLSVIENLCDRISRGEKDIFGIMIESNLVAGKQNLAPNTPLQYGQSITDACISWEDTEKHLKMLSQAVDKQRQLI